MLHFCADLHYTGIALVQGRVPLSFHKLSIYRLTTDKLLTAYSRLASAGKDPPLNTRWCFHITTDISK